MRAKLCFLAQLLYLVLAAESASAGDFRPTSGERVEGEYIVVFRPGVEAAAAAHDRADFYDARVEAIWKEALNGALLVDLTEEAAHELAWDPAVEWVEENAVTWADATQNNPVWGLDRIDQNRLPRSHSYTYYFDGSGVNAFILDTGIRDTHSEFGARASRDFDNFNDGQNGYDCNGHGTHVAGTLGGATYGVAKNVRLRAVRVLDCTGSGTTGGAINGLNFVINNAVLPAVANMSLGAAASPGLDTAVANAVAAGIFVAVSAGNANANACNQSPARAPQAYTVASTDSSDQRASTSSFGNCVDTFAPGEGVLSAWNSSDTATNTLNGTSMASPHAAGVAALLLDEDSTRTVATVTQLLDQRATANVVGNPGAGSPNRLLYPFAIVTPDTFSVTNERCRGRNSLTWASVSGATYYELYSSSTSDFFITFLAYSGSATSRNVNVSSTTYYRVRACNAGGCGGFRRGNAPATYHSGCQ